jgi:uncharacterized protein (TIGR02271 family)
MTISIDEIKSVSSNGKVVTGAGDKIGGVGQVYLDDATGAPTWVTVRTGLFGTAESFVPLEGARLVGDDIVVAFDKETIKDSPRVEVDGTVTPAEEQELFRHYGLQRGAGPQHDQQDVDRTAGPTGDAGVADSGLGDDAMTRSEEKLEIGTETRVAGRAVLRKYVVTEYVTQTVPVRREEVRIEHVPIDEAEGETLAADASPFTEGDIHEVILYREVPVVSTKTVAVERVRMSKVTLNEEAAVSEDLRKERIDVDEVKTDSDLDTSAVGNRGVDSPGTESPRTGA